MRIFKYLIPVVIAIIALASCKKIETLPDTPHIEFRSFAVFDTSDILDNNCKGGRLNIYFEDGDGDLGLEPPVYENDDTVDMYFTLYRKKGTIFSEVPGNDPIHPSDYRIPYMERTGQNKALRGTISVTFLYLYYSPEDTDTVKYEFYIKDRAQHISDTVITSEIKLSVNGVYL
ncbi:MAG: hypothetical protein NT092_00785 [Bacteroidia bacterium]|nr:hypothetical protein [Bacteroidia bacterium]